MSLACGWKLTYAYLPSESNPADDPSRGIRPARSNRPRLLERPNSRSSLPFAEKARELDGLKVFLKGYVRPGAKTRKLKNFILVGDFGDCCFGGNPKMTEVVAIKILGDKTIDHSYSLRKIGGTFRLNESRKRTSDDEVPLVYYEIEADHIR